MFFFIGKLQLYYSWQNNFGLLCDKFLRYKKFKKAVMLFKIKNYKIFYDSFFWLYTQCNLYYWKNRRKRDGVVIFSVFFFFVGACVGGGGENFYWGDSKSFSPAAGFGGERGGGKLLMDSTPNLVSLEHIESWGLQNYW